MCRRVEQDFIYNSMNKLNSDLRDRAVSLGLCAKWQRMWETDKTPQELIDMWKRGIDFGLEHDYPSTEFIKANFAPTLLHENLIFVDEYINIGNAPNGVYIINGECSGTLRFRDWAVATVYVRHTSSVSIIAEDCAKVFVRIYDDADASVCEVGDAVVKVHGQ